MLQREGRGKVTQPGRPLAAEGGEREGHTARQAAGVNRSGWVRERWERGRD